MSYSSGGLIQATDYNGFASTTAGGNVNYVWNTQYGQTALNTVSTSNLVTAAQWATLNNTISSLASHQGTIITSRTNPAAGEIISVLPHLNTDITNCNTNQYNAATHGTQYTAWTGTASKTTATGSGGSAWNITFTDTITFANTTAASSFFNAGGLVKIQFSKTSTGTSADARWNNFVNNLVGTIYLSSTGASKYIVGQTYTGTTKIGGSGTPTVLSTGIGYAQLTSTPNTIYKQFDNGTAYSANYVQLNVSVSGSVITLTTVWHENGEIYGTNISGGTATTGITFGTAPTTVVTYFPPETTYLANVWGTPAIVSSVV